MNKKAVPTPPPSGPKADGYRSILKHMSDVNLRRLVSALIGRTDLTPAQNTLAEWVMDEINTGRAKVR
jgi:hypothetical protein